MKIDFCDGTGSDILSDVTVAESAPESDGARLVGDPSAEAGGGRTNRIFVDGNGTVRPAYDPKTIPGVTTAANLKRDGGVECEYRYSRLLFHVKVYRWPQKYNFYQRFLYDAERLFAVRGQSAPTVPYFSYIPQYAQLNAEQMRCYLWFRERARAGECDASVDFPYILLYIYEIINLPHRISPAEGAQAIAAVWLSCRGRYPELDKYLAEWMCDYCLSHRLPLPQSLSPILYDLVRIASFKEFYISALPPREDGMPMPPEMLLAALSDYSYRSSRYYTENAAAFDEKIPSAVVAALRDGGLSLDVGQLRTATTERDAFCGSLCAQTVKRRIVVEYGSLFRSYALRSTVTAAVKTAENLLRRDLKIKSRLSVKDCDPSVQASLQRRFPPLGKHRNDAGVPETWEKLYDAPSVGIDYAEAGSIEQSSWANTELLVPEETAVPETVSPAVPEPAMPEKTAAESADAPDVSGAPYLDALRAMLAGESLEAWCARQTEKRFPDRVAAQINDAAVDVLGDVALENADGWQMIEEYRDEIRAWIDKT